MKSIVLGLALAALALGATAAQPDRRTQLEYAAGISAEEAGLYTTQQLSMIKWVLQKDRLSEAEKQARIKRIKQGKIIGLTLRR